MNFLLENFYPYTYLVGWVLMWVIRLSHLRNSLNNPGTENEGQSKDKLLVLILFNGNTK